MSATTPPTVLERLATPGLRVVTGKGGVGKTAISAVLARELHERGCRVLLLEVDPRENLHEMLAVAPSGGEVVEIEPGLWLQHLRPRAVLEHLVRERLRIEMLARRVLDSPMFHHFVEGAPGLREMAVLGHALQACKGTGRPGTPRADVVVLDAPATGHGVSMLDAPLLVGEVIDHGPIGRLAGELAEFVGDPERTGVIVTTLAEEMPAQESLELRAEIERRLSREPELLVINGLYPPPGGGAFAGDDLLRARHEVNRRWLGRLRSGWSGPRAELPLLPLARGPELVESLRSRLVASLAAEDGR